MDVSARQPPTQRGVAPRRAGPAPRDGRFGPGRPSNPRPPRAARC